MVNLNKPAPEEEAQEEEQLKEPVLVREITALYSDGTSEQVDIGRFTYGLAYMIRKNNIRYRGRQADLLPITRATNLPS